MRACVVPPFHVDSVTILSSSQCDDHLVLVAHNFIFLFQLNDQSILSLD